MAGRKPITANPSKGGDAKLRGYRSRGGPRQSGRRTSLTRKEYASRFSESGALRPYARGGFRGTVVTDVLDTSMPERNLTPTPRPCSRIRQAAIGPRRGIRVRRSSGTTTTDVSGNTNNGATGILVSPVRPPAGSAAALLFDGSSGIVTIPDAASLRLTNAMTLEAWVNPTAVSNAWRDVIYKGNDNYYLMATSTRARAPAGGATFGK